MKFENHSPISETGKHSEQGTNPEKDLANAVREKFSKENFGNIPPISPERNLELQQEIDAVYDLFQKAEKPWFIGGGTALELHSGILQRDHKDHDVFIWRGDTEDFMQVIRETGYAIFHVGAGEADTQVTDAQLSSETNFHVKKPQGDGVYIDLRVLPNKAAKGDLSLTKDAIDKAGKFTTNSGREVVLENRAELVMNKIFGGRQLDYFDLKMSLPKLSQDERDRLDSYLEQHEIHFSINGKETKKLEELMQLAEESTEDVKAIFLEKEVDGVIGSNIERLNTTVEKISQIMDETDGKEGFLEGVQKVFGEDVVVQREVQLHKIAKFIFEGEKPTYEVLRKFAMDTFQVQQIIEEELQTNALKTKRWEVIIKENLHT